MRPTAIVIPCFNESGRLKIQAFFTYSLQNSSVHFIFVDDGSSDDTYEIMTSLQRLSSERVHLIRTEENKGKADAVRRGILFAMSRGFDYVGFWDADLSTPLNSIDIFRELLDSTSKEIVIGARVKLLGRRIERLAFRHYLGRIFATFASLILRIPVYDTQCGAKIFKRTPELEQVFATPFTVKWAFDVELLARFALLRKKNGGRPIEETVIEYPLEVWIHVPGSKIRIKDFFLAPFELMKLFFLFYTPGLKQFYFSKFTDLSPTQLPVDPT